MATLISGNGLQNLMNISSQQKQTWQTIQITTFCFVLEIRRMLLAFFLSGGPKLSVSIWSLSPLPNFLHSTISPIELSSTSHRYISTPGPYGDKNCRFQFITGIVVQDYQVEAA